MNRLKSTVIALLPVFLAGCATTSSRLPLPPALEYINEDPANVHFDRSSIYVAARLITAEPLRPDTLCQTKPELHV